MSEFEPIRMLDDESSHADDAIDALEEAMQLASMIIDAANAAVVALAPDREGGGEGKAPDPDVALERVLEAMERALRVGGPLADAQHSLHHMVEGEPTEEHVH